MTTRVVVLSPHLDDAVLSCWHLVTRPGTLVVNVFAGVPPAGTSTLLDRVCGQRDSAAMVRRRIAEDGVALGRLGIEPINLPHLDRQYTAPERDLEAIAADVLAAAGTGATFYAPAACGAVRHPDHVALRHVAERLSHDGEEVVFYADLPYMLAGHRLAGWAERLDAGKVARSLGTPVVKRVHRLDDAEAARKQAAVRSYATQFRMVALASLGLLWRQGTYRAEVTFHTP